MTSYFVRYQFYQEMFIFKVFQYKISDRMSCSFTLYNNFEYLRKMISLWEIQNLFFFTRFLIIHGITDWYQILGIFLSILFMKNFSKLLFLKKKTLQKEVTIELVEFFLSSFFFFYQETKPIWN